MTKRAGETAGSFRKPKMSYKEISVYEPFDKKYRIDKIYLPKSKNEKSN